MKLKLLGAGAVLALGFIAMSTAYARADVIYTYTGNPFVDGVNGTPPPDLPYTTSDRVTGQFTVPTALAPNLVVANVTPTSFHFSDGVQTVSNLTTFDVDVFQISTNGSAAISAWTIILLFNQTQDVIQSVESIANVQDRVVQSQVGAEVNANPGVWIVTPVPAPVAGAGVPGLLAGVLAFLFWQGRSAGMALVRRRQRLLEPVAS